MIPLRVRLHLQSGPAGFPLIMLDGLILFGEAARIAAATEAGWIPEEEAINLPLPLAKVTLPDGRWWYAASGAYPPDDCKKQHVTYVNRRPEMSSFLQLTTAGSIDERAGADKLIHRPSYIFPEWLIMDWTCIGDPVAIRRALSYVIGVGPRVAQGIGMRRPFDAWEVIEDPTAPPLEEYRTNVHLRPIPMDAIPMPSDPSLIRAPMPLRPPYWSRGNAELCWKVQ